LSKPLLRQLQNYWNHRAPEYHVPDVFGRNVVQAYLRKLKPRSLIEVGCGSGELFPLYKRIPHVVAVDWSSEMLERSRRRINRHAYPNITLKQLDITCEAVPERFDVLLTRTVLMHIPPEHIFEAAVNLLSMSKQLLLFEFYQPDQVSRLAPHNWHHNYPVIFMKLGCKLMEWYDRPDGLPQVLFYFKHGD